jgi:hypothetical protein
MQGWRIKNEDAHICKFLVFLMDMEDLKLLYMLRNILLKNYKKINTLKLILKNV